MAFSSDNRFLAAAHEHVRVWDLRDPDAGPVVLQYNAGRFTSLAFSSDGEFLAGANISGKTLLWSLASPTTAPLSLPGSGTSVAFAPSGQLLAVAGIDGSVRLWSMGAAAADSLCTRVWRNLSMDEWRLYVGETIPYERTCPTLPPGAGVPGARP
jgi:WD40 repeat protein